MKSVLMFVAAIVCGCSTQFSTLPKDQISHKLTNDSALVRYHATYKMNMSTSESIILEIENTTTKQRFRATKRDTAGWPYIIAPFGDYRIYSLTIIEPIINKCIKALDDKGTYVYGFSDSSCIEISAKRTRGNINNGIALLGDLQINKSMSCFASFSLRPAETVTFAPFMLKGKIKSLAQDLPNVEISQNKISSNPHLFCNDTISFSR